MSDESQLQHESLPIEQDIELLKQRISQLESENRNIRDALSAQEKVIADVMNSWSWRISAPIRFGGRLFRVLKNVLWLESVRLGGRAYRVLRNTARLQPALVSSARPWLVRDSGRRRSDSPTISCILLAVSEGVDPSATIRSIARQTIAGIEVLIGVTDSSVQTGFEAIPENMRLIRIQDSAMSGANAAARLARGKYICFLPVGDSLYPTCIEKMLLILEKHDADIAGCQLRELWSGARLAEPFWKSLNLPDVPFLIIRKSLWQHSSGVDSKYERYAFWEFLLRCLRAGAVPASVPENLQHAWNGSVSEALPSDGALLAGLESQFGQLLNSADLFDRQLSTNRSFLQPPSVMSFVRKDNTSTAPSRCILLAMPFLTVGGAERSLSQIIRHLALRGFRFVVMTTEPIDPRVGDTTEWFEESTLEVFHLPRYRPSNEWADFIKYLLQSREIPILWIAGSTFTYDLLPILKSDFPNIHVVDILFNPVGMTTHYLKYNYLIDRIIVEHAEMKSWLVEKGEREDLISIIPNGVDVGNYIPVPKLSWRELSGMPAVARNRFTVGFIGRLSEEKSPEVFVAIAEVLRSRTDIEFIVCGKGIMYAEMWELVERSKLKNIHFLGFVDPQPYLSCCDALVVCSKMDGRPNVVMESFASGVPVIASRVGALPIMVQDGITGLLCSPGDVAGFASSVERMADEPLVHSSMKRSARKWAEEHFAIGSSIDQYESLFQTLISNGNS